MTIIVWNMDRVLCATLVCAILFEVSSGAQIGDPLDGKSAISTEYKARFHKIHPNGVNASEGYIEGVHNMEKNTDQESWPSFASKCAEVIKGIVTALTGAVSSQPGEKTDLHLDFKNRIYHHDNRVLNESDVDAFTEAEQREIQDEILKEITTQNVFPDDYTGMGNPVKDISGYPDATSYQYGTQSPVDLYGAGSPEVVGRPLQLAGDGDGLGVTQAAQEPTWNTPATQEILYRPTEQVTQIPRFIGRNPAATGSSSAACEECGGDVTTQQPYLGSQYPAYETNPSDLEDSGESEEAYQPPYPDNLPLDNWKPVLDEQQDFLPETPGFNDAPTSSGHLFTVPQEIYTTQSPVVDSGLSQNPSLGSDDSALTLDEDGALPYATPESANQVSQPSGCDECEAADSHEDNNAEVMAKAYAEAASEAKVGNDGSGEGSSCSSEEQSGESNQQAEEDSSTTFPDLFVPDATQIVPVETMPPEEPPYNSQESDSEEMVAAEPGNIVQRPAYGEIYKMLASTTPPPPPPPSPAIYIPITSAQTDSMPEGAADPDEDCCCDEDTYDEETPNHKVICKNACRDLEQARNELKAIFDKIKKKLKCSRRLPYSA